MDLLVTVVMQLDHKLIDMSSFVTALMMKPSSIVEAYIDTIALQPLLDKTDALLTGMELSCLGNDTRFKSNLGCLTAVVINLNPRGHAFTRIVARLFPEGDANWCPLGLAHDLHRLAHHIITRPAPNAAILEDIILTLSSLKRHPDHSLKPNSILNSLMVLMNQVGGIELKSVRTMLASII